MAVHTRRVQAAVSGGSNEFKAHTTKSRLSKSLLIILQHNSDSLNIYTLRHHIYCIKTSNNEIIFWGWFLVAPVIKTEGQQKRCVRGPACLPALVVQSHTAAQRCREYQRSLPPRKPPPPATTHSHALREGACVERNCCSSFNGRVVQLSRRGTK